MLRRLRLDPYLLLLLATVGVASLLPARGGAATLAGHVVTVAIGVLFFLYGARLAPRTALAGLRHWRLHGSVFLATFVLFPLLGLAVQLLPPSILSPHLAIGVLFLCCLPSTVQSSIAFTSVARGNVAAAVCAASFSNLAGVVGTPLLAGLLLAAHGGSSGRALLDIGLQLLAPFLLGQLLQPWIGGWIGRHRRLLGVVDRGSILLIVYVAFSASMVAGIWRQLTLPDIGVLLAVDAAVLAVMLLVTVVASRALGLERADRITILFCGSTKSLAAGLPMASVLFAGQPVGLVVLPLMLFHQLQLMVGAALAPRLARRDGIADARPVAVG
ncbi:bile acid:sodium symporter family protein [Pseudonocardia asaccharolytica]|uniref:Bile acid:sodium symporter n=1 Tax=Pseudonocardia asaccharolytica DSM 44247 = NBRC 16224 TaxID=1123024 RepID=A0A511D1I2_9PSEU|nr:bile acid:sodium symporter family protein [Pseudonocardia asaccharolytica]GEL16748.1 bile acid:sodium symporter [Pseudonocardia asaccharolytica DSM 44247 = NBRC 16224]